MNNSDFPLESTLSSSVLLTKGCVQIGIEWETKPYFRINTSHDHEVHDHFLFADPYQFFLPTNHDLQTGILLFNFYLILQTESESDHLGLKVEQKNRMQPVIFIDNLSVHHPTWDRPERLMIHSVVGAWQWEGRRKESRSTAWCQDNYLSLGRTVCVNRSTANYGPCPLFLSFLPQS